MTGMRQVRKRTITGRGMNRRVDTRTWKGWLASLLVMSLVSIVFISIAAVLLYWFYLLANLGT